ncbi:ferritin-like domain-containing protein [candidate division KSB1 bacterium]|nr:MAG: ferritin-like domain-containing protein [candidate division KSB1 bacterium]MBC6947434.1 ferritin-like domain-containing protein [candidate division KSB1 bacterium]MCE7945192.1 ferritin-like domain-containing protein [Chlorobi bacterium CHB1]MDL1874224.1 ferritin-like domain-containing protein [Cytophagia bacterium CHB2]
MLKTKPTIIMSELEKKLEQGWEKLTALLDPKQRAEKTLLEALQRDYLEERQTSEVLQKESGHVPYAQLRRKLLDIAAREQEHAELLAAKIRELGGEPSERAANLRKERESKTSPSTLDLLQILEREKDDYIQYLEAAHLAKEAGHENWTPLLTQIADEEQIHRRELMDIITRLNPLPVQS